MASKIKYSRHKWEHMKNQPHIQIYNGDDGLRELFLDGIHWHNHCCCHKEFEWKVIKREEIQNIEEQKHET